MSTIIIQGLKSNRLITQGYAAAPIVHIYSSSAITTSRTIVKSTGAPDRTIKDSSGEVD